MSQQVSIALKGFKNFNVNCYANSVLQCLSHARQTYEFLPVGVEVNRGSRTSEFWSEFIRLMDNHKNHRLTDSLLRCFLDSLFELFFQNFREDTQEDAHEFYSFILTCLDENYLKMNTQTDVLLPFRTIAAVRTTCVFNHKFQNDDEQLLTLELKLGNGLGTIQNYIQDYLINDPVDYFCPTCRKQVQANRKRAFKSLPALLSIHLARIHHRNGRMFKVDEHVEIPERLEITFEQSNRVQTQFYSLFAVCLHSGRAEAGHYTSN
jgi:ubiquitin carboxyl-terminal hydrolase 5/13